MKRGRSGAFHKSEEEISNFRAIIKKLKDQINYDFYLTRKTTKYFIALLTIIETDGIQIIKKIYKVDDNSRTRSQSKQNQKSPRKISNLTATFFRSWSEFKKSQIKLCNVPFIQLSVLYLKEHLKACNKIITNLINDRNQDIESSSILKYKGKLGKSQMYDRDFISQFKKISDTVTEHIQDLKEDINTLQDRAVSEEDNQVDYHVTDEQSYQFAQFYSDLNGTYSIIFKPFQQYDKDEMKSHHLNCLHHIEKCENCLHPKTKKGFPEYNPWKSDHLILWTALIGDTDNYFEKLFQTLQSQTSFQILKKYHLSIEKYNQENQEENNPPANEEIVIDASTAIDDEQKPKRKHHHHHKKQTNDNDENDYVIPANDNNIIIEEEEEENEIQVIEEEEEEIEPPDDNENDDGFNEQNKNIFNVAPDLNLDEIENLKGTVDNLTLKLKKYKDLYKSEKKKNEDLEARIRAFNDDEIALIQQREINSQLLDENMRLKAKIKELENDILRLKSIMLINSKDDFMNQRSTNIFVVDDGLREEYSRVSKENAEKTIEIDNLRSIVSKLEMDMKISSNVAKYKGDESSEIEERFLLLQQQYKAIEEDNLNLQKITEKKRKFKQDYLQCEQRNKELNECLSKKELEVIQLQKSIAQLHQRNADLMRNQQRPGNIQLNMINPNSDDFMTREQALEKMKRILKEKVQKEEEIRQLKQEKMTQEIEKEDLNRAINTLKQSESALKEELSNKDNQIQNLNEKLNENSKQLLEIYSAKRKMKTAQDENDELNKKINDMKNQINELNDKVKSVEIMKINFDNANQKIQKKKQKIAKLKEQIAQKDSDIDRLKETLRNNDFD